jgi:hypothetical protein
LPPNGSFIYGNCIYASGNLSADLPKTLTEEVNSPSLGHIVQTLSLSYDGNGRLIAMISTANPGDKIIYQYDTDNTFTLDQYNSNQLSIHDLFWIGTNDLVDSSLQYNDTQDTSTTKYVYNASGQMVQQREYDYSTASGPLPYDVYNYTYDNNGNVVSETDYYSSITYDYYSDLPAPSFSLDKIYFPQPKNLPKTMTTTSGGTTSTITHTYAFDSQNRLTTDSAVADDGGTDVKTYTY